ncbi:hypothetical protein ASD28_13375 [Massilia sp. Root133]|jgi:uncharacterized protein YigA (DUF484 family)|uniref:DUF484 family protein n=1 Tax=Massilia cellulosiltytica TaxID=2683234 RepID=A0A7X3FVT0_9BURK|nr:MULTISPECIES: DUF484 family protein [Telluria group]KQY00304.1 hypothetical protein ASD28_13375 [Massilia sp. Root133]KQZ38986.1 hypothetical protein ASD92_03735 [Massilia sp. Root1485]MVW58795.1 DUF484 family protein [Telluria cellulosilytica]
MTAATLDPTAIAQYLLDHPQFFVEHAALLGEVKLSSPLTGRAVSLQERQMEVMRDKYRTLELRMSELVRHAEENAAIANRFHGWTQQLLRTRVPGEIPAAVAEGLVKHFIVPHATLRLWKLASEHADTWYTNGVSEDVRLFASSLRAPYCGPNKDFEAVSWLDGADAVRSTVLLPLRANGGAFGLLVLGSPDPERFSATMATDFLVHIGETASTALAALLD